MENTIIGANEARKIATQVLADKKLKDLNIVNSAIQTAVNDGKFMCRIYNKQFTQYTIDTLHGRGFEIMTVEGGPNETDTVISW